MIEMIEDGLMWPAESLASDNSRPGLDQRLLSFALNYCSVEKILASEGLHLNPSSKRLETVGFSFAELAEKRAQLPAHSIIVEPYNREQKERIYRQEVHPLLAEVLESSDPASRFNSLIWSSFVEFFVDLIWCSRLQIPLVMDMKNLRRELPTVARRIIQEGAVKDSRPFLELLVLLERYKEMEISYFVPHREQARKPLDVWNELRTSVEFRRMATEKRALGKAFDINGQTRVVERVAMNAERAPRVNPIIAKVAGVGKAKVWVFREPEVRIQTKSIKDLIAGLIEGLYIPPIYDMAAMKAQSRYIFMPSVSSFNQKAN